MTTRIEQLKFGMALNLVGGVGNIIAKSLIGYCGSPKKVFESSYRHLEKIPNVGRDIARRIKSFRDFKKAELEIDWMNQNNINAHFYFDKEYPHRLKLCQDAPIILFTNSNIELNKKKVISIVGTRVPSTYGKKFTRELIMQLSGLDCLVVSGMAYGVDIEAHKSSLNNNVKTVGVVAHGMGNMYPSIHKNTAEEMKQNGGGLLSEFWHDEVANRENFPKRNRIIAGLADATIVVESDLKGGSMITADLAIGYGREVFALPGSIYSTKSRGTNDLIKRSKAYMIESSADLIYHLGWERKDKDTSSEIDISVSLNSKEKKVMELLRESEQGIDQLYHESRIPMSDLALLLLDLEFKGLVESLPGKRYTTNFNA